MTADFTKRLPAETLNEIIAWVDERKALLAMAHVCRRWRHVAFDRPRRFCWPGCSYQNIPDICEKADTASLEPAFARLKCRLDHSRAISLRLGALETDTAVAVLKCLTDRLPNVSNLYITWDMDTLTQPVFDALASNTTPLLSSLSLTWTTSLSAWTPQQSNKPRPRIPANILSGTSPALNLLYLTGLDLPEAPLPQFSAVTTVSVDPGDPWDSDVPWPFQDVFAQHFPALNIMIFPAWPSVRLAPAHTPEGMLLMGRLTAVTMSEHMLHAALDDYAELATTESITVYPAYPPDARTLERLLAHFVHDDVTLEARYVSADGAVNVVLSHAGRRREMHVPLDQFSGVFQRASHGLRLVRASLCHEAFAALWPVLPPDCLRSFTVYIDEGLPPKNPTRPRVLPLLSDFVITRDRYSLSKRDEHITLRAGELSKFLRGALRVSGARTVTLRLEGVSVDRVTPAVKRIFAEVIQERF